MGNCVTFADKSFISSTNPAEWSKKQIIIWLQYVCHGDLSPLIKPFKQHQICGLTFTRLTDDILKTELGINVYGLRQEFILQRDQLINKKQIVTPTYSNDVEYRDIYSNTGTMDLKTPSPPSVPSFNQQNKLSDMNQQSMDDPFDIVYDDDPDNKILSDLFEEELKTLDTIKEDDNESLSGSDDDMYVEPAADHADTDIFGEEKDDLELEEKHNAIIPALSIVIDKPARLALQIGENSSLMYVNEGSVTPSFITGATATNHLNKKSLQIPMVDGS